MKENMPIGVLFMTEKIVGHGEDAPPLLIIKGKACAVGVFDGMGGSGATICDSEFGEGHTKAYVASRIVASSMELFLHNHLPTDDVSAEDMKAVIMRKLHKEKESFPPKLTSSLRSKLVRDYPTTLAIVTLQEHDKAYIVDSYWAGDSHCYLWTKDGFFQISKDDLEGNNDPMENLHNDSPVSNCICADQDFRINHIQIAVSPQEPVIILAATDGCFGYYPSPMHFEDVIKRTLIRAKDVQDWGKKIEEQIQKVTGDDASLSLLAVGFQSFDFLKGWASRPCKRMKKLKDLEAEIAKTKKQLEQKTNEYNQSIKSFWDSYKEGYLEYLNIEDNANA